VKAERRLRVEFAVLIGLIALGYLSTGQALWRWLADWL
jgi:Flp pilus assembly pilin Flp